MMDKLTNFFDDVEKDYLYKLYKDAAIRRAKGSDKILALAAYKRLKLDSKKEWPVLSKEWLKYFDKE